MKNNSPGMLGWVTIINLFKKLENIFLNHLKYWPISGQFSHLQLSYSCAIYSFAWELKKLAVEIDSFSYFAHSEHYVMGSLLPGGETLLDKVADLITFYLMRINCLSRNTSPFQPRVFCWETEDLKLKV